MKKLLILLTAGTIFGLASCGSAPKSCCGSCTSDSEACSHCCPCIKKGVDPAK